MRPPQNGDRVKGQAAVMSCVHLGQGCPKGLLRRTLLLTETVLTLSQETECPLPAPGPA